MPKARSIVLAAVLAAATHLTASVAFAQGGYGRGGRGAGGPEGPAGRADSARTLEDQNPIAMVLEHSGDLALTSDQTNRIAAIKQRLNAQQRPLVAELDSLRPPGPPQRLDVTNMSAAERDSLMARRRAVGEVMAQVRTLQQTARTDAWAVLTPDQQTKADALETKLREDSGRARDERGGRGGGRGGRGGMGGMGGGQPPA